MNGQHEFCRRYVCCWGSSHFSKKKLKISLQSTIYTYLCYYKRSRTNLIQSMSKKETKVLDVPVLERHKDAIYIKGARGNNLKNVDLRIPKNKLVVVTGVSGSGKSSITMDTLYAEGQRRYVESLSLSLIHI